MLVSIFEYNMSTLQIVIYRPPGYPTLLAVSGRRREGYFYKPRLIMNGFTLLYIHDIIEKIVKIKHFSR